MENLRHASVRIDRNLKTDLPLAELQYGESNTAVVDEP